MTEETAFKHANMYEQNVLNCYITLIGVIHTKSAESLASFRRLTHPWTHLSSFPALCSVLTYHQLGYFPYHSGFLRVYVDRVTPAGAVDRYTIQRSRSACRQLRTAPCFLRRSVRGIGTIPARRYLRWMVRRGGGYNGSPA